MLISIFLISAFFISELPMLFSKRAKSSKVKNERDKLSLMILCVVIPLCIALGMWIGTYQIMVLTNYQLVKLICVSIFVIGFTIRRLAIYQLGSMFTLNVVITDRHILKTNGLYKIVRHPGYLGYLLMIVGIGISFNNLLSLLITLVPTFGALSYRIEIEEDALIEEFGNLYKDYKNSVKRLIPGLY
jgi:protein-S-isoprenylcysteine O-methyltransferase Ste14